MAMKKVLKFVGLFFVIVFSLIFILYLCLCGYIKSKEIKVDKNKLLGATDVLLSDRQILIASLVLNESSHPEFRNYFFLICDSFSFENEVAMLTASSYIGKYEENRIMNSIDRQFVDLATKRYIMKHIDYRICYNYLFSNFYFGASVVGLVDAAGLYYKKDYKELSDKEFISLCLFVINPIYYGAYAVDHDYDFQDAEMVNYLKKRDEEMAERHNKKVKEIYSKLEQCTL